MNYDIAHKDGILSKLFRDLNDRLPSGKENEMRWVVFDGDVDALWVENMNSGTHTHSCACTGICTHTYTYIDTHTVHLRTAPITSLLFFIKCLSPLSSLPFNPLLLSFSPSTPLCPLPSPTFLPVSFHFLPIPLLPFPSLPFPPL